MSLKIILGYDSQDASYEPFAVLVDEQGKPIDVEVEVRDYGRGSTEDEDGCLYEKVS